MPNALIYSQGFDGHRQVYVFVLAHVLKELGFNIFIAGNIREKIHNSYYIDKLRADNEIKIIDTSTLNGGGTDILPSEFIYLQNECKADLTVFSEADHHISLFISQIGKKNRRFRGKLAGIFLRPFYYYEHLSLWEKLRYLKHLPENWKSDESLFHGFFLRRFTLLDVPLYLDEKFVSHHPYSTWIPDVFQEYADFLVHDEKSEQRVWIEKLESFREKNKGKFLFLYFGTAQFRRGYDILLKLADETGGCFVHCGLNDSDNRFSCKVDELRMKLNREGRLFETNQYIEDPVCIEYFFKSVSHLVLPYRNFFGSSGVMLQALSFGIPVLAPANGIIGYRIKKYNLGRTYNDKKPNSLYSEFDSFRKLNPAIFESRIKEYMSYQTGEQLKKVLVNAFTGTGDHIKQP